ncbi:hypothetical protein CTA2_5536 [Colletotrichum tanaceti]|nr:hypothetical protein CTA2_5536 [Colletotrichum tanaceti]
MVWVPRKEQRQYLPHARAAYRYIRMPGEYNDQCDVCVCADWFGVPCFRATQHDIAWRMHATTGMPFPHVVGRRGYDTCCCRDLEEESMRWFAEFSDECCVFFFVPCWCFCTTNGHGTFRRLPCPKRVMIGRPH